MDLEIKKPFGTAQTSDFTVWYEVWSFWNTYLQNNLGKTRVLIFCKGSTVVIQGIPINLSIKVTKRMSDM